MEKSNQSPLAAVISYSPLLSNYLVEELLDAGLTVHLYHPSSSPLKLTHSSFSEFSDLDRLPTTTPDYVLLLYPSQATKEQLYLLSQTLPHLDSKFLLLETFGSPYFTDSPLVHTLPQSQLRLVSLGHLYGRADLPSPYSPVQSLLNFIVNHQSLDLPAEGQSDLFPLHAQDALQPLLQILFSAGSNHPHYLLSTLDSIRELDLAYLLQNLATEYQLPRTTIDTNLSRSPLIPLDKTAIASSQALLDWQPHLSLDSGLRLSLSALTPKPEATPTPLSDLEKPPIKKTHPRVRLKLDHLKDLLKSSPTRPLLLLPTFLLLFLLLPPFLLLAFSFLGARSLSLASHSLGLDPKRSRQTAQLASTQLLTARHFLQISRRLYFFLPLDSTFNKHDRLLDAGQRLGKTFASTTTTLDQAQTLYHSLSDNNGTNPSELLPSLKSNLTDLHTQFSLVETAIKDLNFNSRLPYLQALSTSKDQFHEFRRRLELGLALLDLLPSTLLSTTPKSYLLLLQDNTELRPTGGFLTAYALLNFESGKLKPTTVSSIYAADQQLGGRVEPPQPLKQYLENNWYVRDANWSPNFSSSARQIQWFFEKELQTTFDGVIALDLDALKLLLNATGPLTSPTLNQIITADNLYQVINQRSQIDFSSSNPSGQDLLVSLLGLLLEQFQTTTPPLASLVSALDQALDQQSLLLSLNDQELQSFLDTKNWGGSLNSPLCPPLFSSCLPQTFALIEANLGINRSNYFLNRRLDHHLTISPEGRLNHDISFVYQNTSPTNTWPGGPYKTYSRFYAPLNTTITSLTLDGQPLAYETATSTVNPNLQEIGFYYEIPTDSTLTLRLELVTPGLLPTLTNSPALAISWEKQPGVLTTPINLTLDFPAFLKPSLLSHPASPQATSLTLNHLLEKDTTFAIQFSR